MIDRVVIGEQPAQNQGNQPPLHPYNKNSSGYRLIQLAESTEAEFSRRAARFNLWPFEASEEEFWDFGSSRLAVSMMKGGLLSGRRVLLLGKRVQAAFGVFSQQKCGTIRFLNCDIEFFYIPHPSGLNRFYNDPENVESAKEIVRKWFRE